MPTTEQNTKIETLPTSNGDLSAPARYAIVGSGARARMFLDAMHTDFKAQAQLVAMCDLSPRRMQFWNRYLAEHYNQPEIPSYKASHFDLMILKARPDVVIVTTRDDMHAHYIVRAMELGCDVVVEKPMTIDAPGVTAICDAIERTGQALRVAFNYRWRPEFTRLREIVQSGQIGTPTLVDFQWRLDTQHGADYFRRWHREKKHSGGLLVHKSTHHFDLVNWILDDRADTLFAIGNLAFYGEQNAAQRGEHYAYDRYTGQPEAADDPFARRLDDETRWNHDTMRGLYMEAETDDGYVRDRNVFGGEDKWPITAEDTMAVTARYTRGTILNYSLIAYCPWEGERLTITGTKGQVEYFGRGQGHVIAGQSDAELAKQQQAEERTLRLQNMFGPPQELAIPEAKGAHGGGDARLLRRIFCPNLPVDPQGRDAGHAAGAWSVLTGAAANLAIETGRPVQLDDLAPASLKSL